MSDGLDEFLSAFTLATFDAGEPVLANTYLQAGAANRDAHVAYVHEGLVRGAWHRPAIAPSYDATVSVSGDRCWIGLDAFKYRENLFRYTALVPTTAFVLPLAALVDRAPRAVLLDALENASLAWCTAVSVVSLHGQGLERRVMLLLYNLRRLHPRPLLEVTQRVVSELLGVSRQALNPVLKDLEQRGFVRLGYGKLVVETSDRLIAELRRTAGDTASPDVEPFLPS